MSKTYIGDWQAGSYRPARPREFTNFREACHVMFRELTRKLRRGERGAYFICDADKDVDDDGYIVKTVGIWKSYRTGGIGFCPSC